MSIVPIKFPLDPSGLSPANLVRDEPKVLNDSSVRVFATRYGPFFTETLVVKDILANRVLIRGRDYYATNMLQIPTEMYGKEVCTVVVVTDPTCGKNIQVSYQALGGEYSYSADAIEKMIATLNLDKRPVKWGNIIGKPEEGFTPAPHLHDVGDTYGWEYIVTALQRITHAIELGAVSGETRMYTYIDAQLKQLYEVLAAITSASQTKQGIIDALGYNPADRAGDTFTGPVILNKGLTLGGCLKEKIIKIRASTNETVVDISKSSIFEITVAASTLIRFDPSQIEVLKADDAVSFTVVIINEVANRGVAFDTSVNWSGGLIPPRTVEVNGRDEYYFSTFNGGASYTGSLSDQDVK